MSNEILRNIMNEILPFEAFMLKTLKRDDEIKDLRVKQTAMFKKNIEIMINASILLILSFSQMHAGESKHQS